MIKLAGAAGAKLYSFDLAPGKHRVGRVQESDICIPDPTVSRSHAELEISESGEQFFLTDLGSHNGTYVNGERVTARRELNEGDTIQFGKTEFTLTGTESRAPSPKAHVRTIISQQGPSTSVMLPIKEVLSALPRKVTELPEFVPAVSEMARLLVATEPQEVMLEKSLHLVSRVVLSDRLLVIFMEGDAARVGASLFRTGQSEGEVRLSKTIVHEIMTNKNSVLISNPETDPRFLNQQSIVMSAMKSAMAVPLFDEDQVLGILYADTRDPRVRYDHDHLRMLATFGHIIASRLSNYRLLLERQAKREMEAELESAAAIQMNLLVDAMPDVRGYDLCAFQEQSKAVGGDLYDVRQFPDGRIFFVVADVSGKGLGAALLMSNMLACFRVMYGEADFQLAQAVERISSQMYTYSASGQFATLFCGLLRPATGSFRYVNAGHNPPLVVRAGGQVERLESTGLMVGAFDFAAWQERDCELAPGDALVVYSDGVTEAQNPALDEFGEDRLRQALEGSRQEPAGEMIARLRNDLSAFVAGAPASDDVTVLVLQRQRA